MSSPGNSGVGCVVAGGVLFLIWQASRRKRPEKDEFSPGERNAQLEDARLALQKTKEQLEDLSQRLRQQASAAASSEHKGHSAPGRWIDAVGESFHQNNFEKLYPDEGEQGVDADAIATMVPENDNPYDPNAVRVDINGLAVGYLKREMAPIFRARYSTEVSTGTAITVPAKVRGGWDRGSGERANFGVKVKLH